MHTKSQPWSLFHASFRSKLIVDIHACFLRWLLNAYDALCNFSVLLSNKTSDSNLEKGKRLSMELSRERNTICSESISNELESDSLINTFNIIFVFILFKLPFQWRENGGSQCMSAKQILYSVSDRQNRWHGFLNAPFLSPSVLPPPSSPLPLHLQMADAILDIFFLYTTNQRSQLHCSQTSRRCVGAVTWQPVQMEHFPLEGKNAHKHKIKQKKQALLSPRNHLCTLGRPTEIRGAE